MSLLMNLQTGKLHAAGDPAVDDNPMWVPAAMAEPYFVQHVGSEAKPHDRTDDGRFDKSHLSPEHAYRIGRDYIAHAMRYGLPMKIIREHFGAGVRILEMGCGKELPLFRTLTCDHTATKYYKPSLYVGADLNKVKYNPQVNGIRSVILSETNLVSDLTAEKPRVPDDVFDIVISFEVLEHMGKDDGFGFIDAAFTYASRKPKREGKPGMIVLSTPVNGGTIAKNHVYEWQRGELRRAFEQRGGVVKREFGTFSNLRDLVDALSPEELKVWNSLAEYHSPHMLSCVFSANHPEVARNIVWFVEVQA